MKKSIFLVCLVVFGVVSLSAIGPIVSVSRLGWQTDSISYGISRMVDIASLPLLDRGIMKAALIKEERMPTGIGVFIRTNVESG